jgi:hypothetical protein
LLHYDYLADVQAAASSTGGDKLGHRRCET